MRRYRPLYIVIACTALVSTATSAAEQAPGETWKVSASFEAMGMTMPARTYELCLPKENPGEALQKKANEDKSCRTFDVVRSGNRVTGKMECKDRQAAMKGTFEVITEGNRIRTTFDGQTADGAVKMANDATRLGTPCQAERANLAAAGVDPSTVAAEAADAAAGSATGDRPTPPKSAVDKGKDLLNGLLGRP